MTFKTRVDGEFHNLNRDISIGVCLLILGLEFEVVSRNLILQLIKPQNSYIQSKLYTLIIFQMSLTGFINASMGVVI